MKKSPQQCGVFSLSATTSFWLNHRRSNQSRGKFWSVFLQNFHKLYNLFFAFKLHTLKQSPHIVIRKNVIRNRGELEAFHWRQIVCRTASFRAVKDLAPQ